MPEHFDHKLLWPNWTISEKSDRLLAFCSSAQLYHSVQSRAGHVKDIQ